MRSSRLVYFPARRAALEHSFRRPLASYGSLCVLTSGVQRLTPVVSPLSQQRRTQYAQVPGKRDQEAFLSQYDPLEVLGLETDCTVEDIDKAFEERTAFYGPNGKMPDPKKVDRVFRAHEILKDPNSPYYSKAHTTQKDRQRLQFQLLPKGKRRLIEFQVGFLMCVLLGIALLVVELCFRPMKRSLRAATR